MVPNQTRQPKNIHLFFKVAALLLALIAVFGFGLIAGEKGYLKKDSPLSSTDNAVSSSKLPSDLDYSSVEKVYDLVRKNYDGDLSEEAFLDELKQGIARATGDPYTEFFNSEEATEFNNGLDGTFTGIGAELGKENGNLIVVSPLAGYPAEAAGVRPKDVIARINEEDTTGFSVFEAVLKIRGEAGTDVNLTLIRNQTEVVEVTITRQIIDVPSVKAEIIDNIGVITIGQFSDDTSSLVEQEAKRLASQNVAGYVLDLRGNPGGYLDQAAKVLGVWLDSSSLAVEVRKGDKVIESLNASGSGRLVNKPTIVLINEGSASASEIVAGALQDYDAATIVGIKSFGKGSVQNINKLSGGEELKITTSRWYTPNGNNIDQEGITPDIEVELTEEDFDTGADPQLDKALELLR